METREKLRISSSSLYTYDDCEHKFKIAYIDKVRPKLGGSIYSVFGTAMHSAIGDFYLRGDFDDISSICATWPERLASEVAAKKIPILPHKLDEFRELGFDMLDTFYLRQKEDGFLVAPKHHEKKMVYETDRYVVVGILDIAFGIDGGVEICDFKTGSKVKTKKEMLTDHQLTMYAWLYWKTYGEIPKKLSLHYLKPNKKLLTVRTQEELEAFGQKVEDFYNEVMAKQEWKPNFSHCHWCDFREDCSHSESRKIRLV